MVKVVNSQKWAQELLEDSILLPLDLVLIFCVSFSGDYAVAGVPLFFVFWLVIYVIRRNFKLGRAEFVAQILILFTFFPIILQADKYSIPYYFGAYYVILYTNVIVFSVNVVERLLSDSPGSKLARWLPAISLLFLGVLNQHFVEDSVRQSFLFGPNVYYRVIGVVFLLHFVLFQEDYTSKNPKMWSSVNSLLVTIVSLNIALSIMIKTGSRGATIVGGFILLCFILSILAIKIKSLKIASLGVITCIIIFILNSAISSNISNSRAFWFYDRGSSSSSIATREGFLENLPSFFLKDNFLLGEGSSYLYYYPHNLYLDLLYNAGIIPFLILLVFTAIYIILFWKGKVHRNWKILTLVLSPIYIGSLVSGTLYDNYPVISMIILFPVLLLNHNRASFAKI